MIYEFEPTQDLHGYEKPWAGGANVNIMDPDSSYMTGATGYNKYTVDDGNVIITGNTLMGFIIPVEPSTKYYAAFYQNLNRAIYLRIREYSALPTAYEAASFITQPVNKYSTTPGRVSDSFTTSATTAYILFAIYRSGSSTPPLTISQWFLQKGGDSIAPYTPYANICMPEGFNMWNPTTQEYTQVYSGFVNSNTREIYLRPIYQEYAGEELVGPWMSSMDEYSEDATPTTGAFVIDFGGELTSFEITPFMLQTLLDSLGIRQNFADGASLLNSLMDQAQGRVRLEEELLHLSLPLRVIAIGDHLPAGIKIKPISKDVLPGLPGKFIR